MLLDTRTIYGSRALHSAPTNHTLQTEVKGVYSFLPIEVGSVKISGLFHPLSDKFYWNGPCDII